MTMEMKTGNTVRTTEIRDVNGKNKHSVNVDPADMMLQSSSRSRGGDMSLKSVRANPKDQMC